MATRAVNRSGHRRAGASSRAAIPSSQSSGSSTESGRDHSSLESGRERRRKGKLKMQQRIHSLESQLADATSRISGLIELVNEISQRCAHQDPSLSAEIFDLFGDDADVVTSEAAAQTDISVDLNKPDVFLTLPLNHPAHADANTACADAAAGAGNPCVTQHLDQCGPLPHELATLTTRLRNFTNVPQDFNSQDLATSQGLANVCAFDEEPRHDVQHSLDRVLPSEVDGTLQQAPDDVNARHCSVSQQQLRDDVPARPGDESHEPDDLDVSSQNLALFPKSHGAKHKGQYSLDPATTSAIADTPQQAPEVVHSRHCGVLLEPDVAHSGVSHDLGLATSHDFNSQGLAKLCAFYGEPRHNEQHSLDLVPPGAVDGTLQQAPDDDHARHCSVSQLQLRDDVLARHCDVSHEPDVLNVSSQNPALLSKSYGANKGQHFLDSATSCAIAATPQLAPEDVNSRHCGVLLEPDDDLARHSGVSKDLGNVARSPCVVRADSNSQDLAPSSEIIGTVISTQCGPLPRHGKPESENQEDSYSHDGTALSFGPSAHELRKALVPQKSLATKDLSRTLRPSERESQRAFPKTQQPQASVLPHGFVQVASAIIEVYGKRRKPRRNHLIDAATALIRAAKMHEVAIEDCQHFVGGKSLALECAMTELGHTA